MRLLPPLVVGLAAVVTLKRFSTIEDYIEIVTLASSELLLRFEITLEITLKVTLASSELLVQITNTYLLEPG